MGLPTGGRSYKTNINLRVSLFLNSAGRELVAVRDALVAGPDDSIGARQREMEDQADLPVAEDKEAARARRQPRSTIAPRTVV